MEFDDDPTDLVPFGPLAEDADTAKHRSIDYLLGREEGYTTGVLRALNAIEAELRKNGASDQEIKSIRRRLFIATEKNG